MNAKVEILVFYTTEHPSAEAESLWKSSEGTTGHYIVTKEGAVWQFVSDADCAFHAGNRRYNEKSIAVAVEGYANRTNKENDSAIVGWRTDEQFDAFVDLVRWLAKRHGIPLDREHLIGKNQVPGVSIRGTLTAGPEHWGGATNKYAPGSGWNWSRLMGVLGRPIEQKIVELRADAAVRTGPNEGSPVVTKAWMGQRAICYDENQDYYLVYVVGKESSQPFLTAGEYHWDGWIVKSSASEVLDNVRSSFSPIASLGQPLFDNPSGDSAMPRLWADAGKFLAPTGRRIDGIDGYVWAEVDVFDPVGPERAWILCVR